MAFKILFLVTVGLLAASAAVLEHDGDAGPVSNTCLRCINEVVGSDEARCNGLRCGPLKIAFHQWQTAYNIKGTDMTEYEKCRTNAWCAVRTLQEYMDKTLKQCVRRTPNADRFRTVCESALILHTGDEKDCRENADTGEVREMRDTLLECLDRRASAWLSEGSSE